MKVVEYVGLQEVVASGTLVLAGGHTTARVVIENITYEFVFVRAPLPPSCTRETTDLVMRLIIVGQLDAPRQWFFAEVGWINSKTIDLAFTVSQFAADETRPFGTVIQYTFSAQNAPLGLLT